MASVSTETVEAELLVREFARVYPTPKVKEAVALCEAGRLTWTDVATLFAVSAAKAMREVKVDPPSGGTWSTTLTGEWPEGFGPWSQDYDDNEEW